jgi:hypothetical protein
MINALFQNTPTVPLAFIASSRELGHSDYAIHVKSCHSCQIMSFVSNHVIHVKSCHSCQIMSYVTHVMSQCIVLGQWYFSNKLSIKSSGRGRGRVRQGQICLPGPSATALLSGRRQQYNNNGVYYLSMAFMDIALKSLRVH